MPNVTANGIQIEYDTFGDRSSPALLLIMGGGEPDDLLGSRVLRAIG